MLLLFVFLFFKQKNEHKINKNAMGDGQIRRLTQYSHNKNDISFYNLIINI